jgi:hypothetical protein
MRGRSQSKLLEVATPFHLDDSRVLLQEPAEKLPELPSRSARFR